MQPCPFSLSYFMFFNKIPTLASGTSLLSFSLFMGTFHNSYSILVIAFSSFWQVALFLAFYLVVHQPCNAETGTCLQPYNPFHVKRIGTRADANIHKTFACRYLSNNICTVVEVWHHGYFCLGYFSASTHFYLVKGLARKVWRQCVLVFAHDLGFRGGNSSVSLRTLSLVPLVTETFSSFNAD